MMHFCTLFDSNYISKGIALYLSIEQHTKEFTLYVMAMDRKCQEMLNAIGFEHVVVDCVEDIDDPALATAKGNRSRAEFCWTCGSYTTDLFLHKYQLPDITYLDSDLMFFCSPQVVFDELKEANASVGIVSHHKKYNLFGTYNVEYVYFKNDVDGVGCLRWWRDECLKWCYNKVEDGKYGDQMYLDYFAERFNNVYCIQNRGVGIASWNMNLYKYRDGKVVYKEQSWPYVFFHYSGFRVDIKENELIFRHTIYLRKVIIREFVTPYANLMNNVFSNYLNTSISDTIVKPLDKKKYAIRTVWYYLDKFLPIEWLVMKTMKKKYKVVHSPYSER